MSGIAQAIKRTGFITVLLATGYADIVEGRYRFAG
jgi:hypothetical protein